MFENAFKDRRVLVTGHTGFKGSWLCEWLLELGAVVSGIALPPPSNPSLCSILGLCDRMDHHELDIRKQDEVNRLIKHLSPEVIFHLAAKPLVRESYANPYETWSTNVMGTANVLEAIRECDSVSACVIVTSDKCYETKKTAVGVTAFSEDDCLGGHDPYSASKGATEILVSSYSRSFFKNVNDCNIATARAGNVIGGGDWAVDRIVVDFVNAILSNQKLKLRNPNAIRPWQHVLDPLSGYLQLAGKLLADDGHDYQGAWNFGPDEAASVTVLELAEQMTGEWGCGEIEVEEIEASLHETNELRLCCDKAKEHLEWMGNWTLPDAVKSTADWYRSWSRGEDMRRVTVDQLTRFCEHASSKKQRWIL